MRKNDKKDMARMLFEAGMRLVDIAKEIGVPSGTVRRWKKEGQWETKTNERERAENDERSKKCTNKVPEKEIPSEERSEASVLSVQEEKLTDDEKEFCWHYARSLNMTSAARKVYELPPDAAQKKGSRLLKRKDIQEEVEKQKKIKYAEARISAEDIFQKYYDIAFADITNFVKFRGGSVSLLPSNTVDGTLISEVKSGKQGMSIKLADREKALEWLADHMDMATEEQKARIEHLRADTKRIEQESGPAADIQPAVIINDLPTQDTVVRGFEPGGNEDGPDQTE